MTTSTATSTADGYLSIEGVEIGRASLVIQAEERPGFDPLRSWRIEALPPRDKAHALLSRAEHVTARFVADSGTELTGKAQAHTVATCPDEPASLTLYGIGAPEMHARRTDDLYNSAGPTQPATAVEVRA